MIFAMTYKLQTLILLKKQNLGFHNNNLIKHKMAQCHISI